MKMSKKYELMTIISSAISDAEIKKAVSGIKELLGGEVVFEEVWGMRDFAYQIKKQDKGYYVVWNFMMDSEAVKELEKTLKLYPNLLRFLLMQVPQDYTPMALADIEAGIAALTEEKKAKRGQVRNAAQKRTDKEESPDEPAVLPAAPAAKKNTPEEKPSQEKTADNKKTLDEKLDAILNDEVSLGL